MLNLVWRWFTNMPTNSLNISEKIANMLRCKMFRLFSTNFTYMKSVLL
jgi:hypothetical protein